MQHDVEKLQEDFDYEQQQREQEAQMFAEWINDNTYEEVQGG